MITALRSHWPEYLMEAAGLGIFMISACTFGTIMEHPGSTVHQTIPDPFLRRILMGTAMGLTAIGIVYSPWGKQSGGHLNPAMTLTFFKLGKIKPWDAVFYVVAQFAGGIAGVLLVRLFFDRFLAHPLVNFVVTVPGSTGEVIAFAGEFIISFVLMTTVLIVSNTQHVARYTGLLAGILVASYIAFEAPFSGMSMNPARTVGSAFSANVWTALWVYFLAPPLAMLAASEVYVRMKGRQAVVCAKLHHQNDKRCIHCGANM
jgi:aquaporin Z